MHENFMQPLVSVRTVPEETASWTDWRMERATSLDRPALEVRVLTTWMEGDKEGGGEKGTRGRVQLKERTKRDGRERERERETGKERDWSGEGRTSSTVTGCSSTLQAS
jgi:hypothetical protein